MSLINQILDGVISLYLILGSSTWGYILLRIGWPNIRSLEPAYKKGWSIVFGIIFSMLVLVSSAIVFFLELTGMAFFKIVLLNSIIFLSAGIILFTLKRKFLGTKKVKVSVPKRVISANVVAKKAVKKLPEESYAPTYTDRQHRINELKDRLENIKPIQQAAPVPTAVKATPFMKKTIQSPLKDMKSTQPNMKPAEVSMKQFQPSKPEPISPEKTKRLDKIIQNLEENQTAKDNQSIVTRQEMDQQTEARKRYITENLRAKVSIEKKPEENNLEKEMPRSAKLLKELLKETEDTK
ncbi:MAG: hypothetical protein ABIH20_01335 [Candidatus Diapherotrites archaeon]